MLPSQCESASDSLFSIQVFICCPEKYGINFCFMVVSLGFQKVKYMYFQCGHLE